MSRTTSPFSRPMIPESFMSDVEQDGEDEADCADHPFFQPAIIIRSDQARLVHVPDPERTDQAVPLVPASSLLPPPPKQVVWREWNINPAKHGPERLTRPPVFVQSKGNYDELGRSVLDGVQVDVEAGPSRPKKATEDGTQVAEWYSALSRSGSGSNTPNTPQRQEAVPVQAIKVSKEEAIDLTIDDDEEDVKPSSRETSPEAPSTPAIPLRVNRNEWFIRRALLKSHQSGVSTSFSTTHPRTSSIGSMLGVTPIQHQPKQHQYAIGPENKGYTILKDQFKWSGGGLGRPAGWVDEPGPSRINDIKGLQTPSATTSLQEKLERDIATTGGLPIKAEDGVVDLTADSASEGGSDMGDDVSPEGPSGPGRTMPIATQLKLDRLGIGHARAQRDKQGNSLKRVTHSHKEIQDAQRRAKFRKPDGVELGKKGRTKWKEKDRKDRDDRRRLAAALNA